MTMVAIAFILTVALVAVVIYLYARKKWAKN